MTQPRNAAYWAGTCPVLIETIAEHIEVAPKAVAEQLAVNAADNAVPDGELFDRIIRDWIVTGE